MKLGDVIRTFVRFTEVTLNGAGLLPAQKVAEMEPRHGIDLVITPRHNTGEKIAQNLVPVLISTAVIHTHAPLTGGILSGLVFQSVLYHVAVGYRQGCGPAPTPLHDTVGKIVPTWGRATTLNHVTFTIVPFTEVTQPGANSRRVLKAAQEVLKKETEFVPTQDLNTVV